MKDISRKSEKRKKNDYGYFFEVNCKTDDGYCGKCCINTEMPLTEKDIRRIEKLGYSREDFTANVDGISQLRNIGGECFFLEKRRCKIYEFRPEGCRIYPLVLNKKNEVVLDSHCPLGEKIGNNIRSEDRKKAKEILLKLVSEIYGDL